MDKRVSGQQASWRYATEQVNEPDPIAKARAHSLELGITPIDPAIGAQCAVLAAASDALNLVEIGTGAGVSGMWLLRGSARGILTTIDAEPEHLAAARKSFADAGIPPARARFITGRAADVLPRMNESAYDIVLIDADPEHILEYVAHALRLVRVGGTVLIPRALQNGRVADPVQRDPITTAFRSLIHETQESQAVIPALSIVGDGLLQLTKITE